MTGMIGAVAVVVAGAAGTASAEPMPLARRTAGMLAADLTLNRVYILQDLNADGDAMDAGEIRTFFDENNASGLVLPTGAVLAMYQRADGTVFICDNDTRTVYALRDRNGDDDAQDAGEARVFFDQSNASFFGLPTPNGVSEGPDGAIYITNSGVTATPLDSIYRVIDLNGDGDANDAGESSVWLDITTVLGNLGPFSIDFIGDAAYWADLRGSQPDAIYRGRDANGSGSLDVTEVEVFIDEANVFGVQVSFSAASDGTSLYVHESSSSQVQNIYRLTDGNGSGTIDLITEAETVWTEANLATSVPPGVMSNSFDIAVGPGKVAITSNGSADASDAIFVGTDLNMDGDYNDAGETTIFVDGATTAAAGETFPEVIRSILFYGRPCPADINSSGSVTVQDIFDFLALYFTNDPMADINGSGAVTVQDIFDFLALYFAGC